MITSENYNKILKETLINDLKWLQEEFYFLFNNTNSNNQKELALQILRQVIERFDLGEDEEMVDLLATTLEDLEKTYPSFF
ncbi:MAG: hypothetical protein P8Y70_16820 [Candidatus Lokiarchaeota archaeon]